MVRHVVILLLMIPFLSWSQTLDRAYVLSQNRIASELNREGKFLQAKEILDALLLKLQENKAEESFFATTFQTKAKVAQNLGHYEESSRLARKSLSISLKSLDSLNIADSYNTLGINHYFESNYDSTTYYYEKSFEIKRMIRTDPYALAVSAYNLAMVYEDLGQAEKAMELYKQAESHLLNSEIEKNFLSDVYVGMALIYFYAGDISKAEVYAEKAMQRGLVSYGEFNPNMTFVYTTYSNILEAEKKYEESIALLEKNLKIRLETYGEWHRWTCETYYDLANAHVLVKEYDKAEQYYKKAINIGKRINSRQYLSNANRFLAELYLDRGIHLDAAESLLNDSLSSMIEIYGDENDLIAENYLLLAQLFKLKGDESKFLGFIDKSLIAANYRSEDLSSVIGPLQVINSLMLLGEWYLEKFEREGDIRNLLKSYELVDQKSALIKHTQNNFSSDRSRIDFANKYREVFEQDLGLCWLLYLETGEKQFFQKAFELSETNRNTTLLKGLQGIKYRAFGEIPQGELELEKNTKKALEKVKMDLYFEKRASKPDKVYFKALLDERIALSNRLDSIYIEFGRKYPRFKSIATIQNEVSIKEVQNHLDEDTQVITYFLGERSLFTFTITKDTLSFLRADIAKNLTEITNDFKNHLSKREDVDELSYDLFMYLLGQQLNRDKKNIVVIADNILNYIPFEILKTTDDSYLLENYTVSYNGSVGLFLELKDDFFNYETPNNWAGFAPTYSEDEALISTNAEIHEIADITNGEKFIGENAKKETYLLHNKSFSILHFAMHAKIDNENPLYNRLLFEDGELTASEIYTSRSKANLAVLAACNTGFGKIEKGEGVMSMARAFHFSGIPAVVMSLWKVPDQETKRIMIDFYRFLKRGKSKSEALRMAKLKYLHSNIDQSLKHPYYWSGFVINGNTEPLKINTGIPVYLWVGAVIFGVLLMGFVYKKIK